MYYKQMWLMFLHYNQKYKISVNLYHKRKPDKSSLIIQLFGQYKERVLNDKLI